MWLINTTTLELEFFVNPEKGSYAILSHTWGDEEVLFHEFKNLNESHSASSKRGFTKIVHSCEIARQQGLQYAWIDTCCIDKSSSVRKFPIESNPQTSLLLKVYLTVPFEKTDLYLFNLDFVLSRLSY
jgi:heterokaryon incompatibility protein (HET)